MNLPSRVVVLTRPGCHLCGEAEATAAAICEELGVPWCAIDVDTDEGLRARFTDHVPVTLVDQRLMSYWFLDGGQLRTALADEPRLMTTDWIASLDA